ncbi:hypothetical protein RND71_021874 [Anisodus tanguticus]|uniref:Uncharacterized protein n=1 Tax=Anisodus tanguticus TaxID=243964 RepID=A0AAE1RXC4_9SOLA|nr:hypothetical protein RND71_021874 [Anisodus tanguticus]
MKELERPNSTYSPGDCERNLKGQSVQLEYKVSAFGRKLISSIAFTSNFPDQHPVHFLNECTKPEILHAHLIKTQNLECNTYAANSMLLWLL